MTKPNDDLEAVRIVAEALQGFDARDQERIIRWAREKLGLVASPAQHLPTASEQVPPAVRFEPPTPPAATSTVRTPRMVEPPIVEEPEAEEPEVEESVVEEFEVEQPEMEQAEGEQPGAVNILMPAPEHKNRAFLVIGIILMTVAVVFLIVMIASRGK
jgi:hypothetical protein